jgi:uncharacterized protein YukE
VSDKHFTLDIHPAELRAAATQVAELHEQLGTLRTQVGAAPGDIGNAWTGSAATSLKGEMTHLSTVLGTFKGKLDGVPAALRSLAKDYDEALEQLPGLNQKWDAAEQAYQDAVGAADTARTQARQELANADRPPNRAITQEIDDIHSGAISAAASAKQSTQHGLETTFGYLKQWLAQQTRALGSTLHDAGPVSVSDDEVAKWNAGQSPKVDVSSITSQLTLAKQNLDEVERLRIAPEVEDAIDRLQDALDNDTFESNPEEIQDALDAIAEHAGDPLWTKELVDQLKAEGIEDIYKAIDRDLELSEYFYEDIEGSLSGFSDAVAQGISAHDDPEFAAIAQEFIKDGVAGQKIWGLITASENADKRMNSVALAYRDQIESYTDLDGAQSSYPGLFPRALGEAYDGKVLERLLAHADGESLADVLEHCDPTFVDDLAWRLTNVLGSDGFPAESREDYAKIAQVWLDAVDTMVEHFHDARDRGDDYALGPLVALLKARDTNGYDYADMLEAGHLKDIVTDGELMAQLLDDANSGRLKASDVKDMIEDSGAKIQDIMDAVVDYRLNNNDDPESAADNLGHLLRDADIIGDGFKPSVAINSILNSLLSAGVSATKNPLTGPMVDLVKALLGEQERLEKLDKDWDDATAKNGPQQVMAFALYVKYYGTPSGFDDYQANHTGTVTNADEIITHFIDRMQEDANKSPEQREEWENLERLIDAIDDARDEN